MEPIDGYEDNIPAVSAGHTVHEWTTFSAMKEIFKKLKSDLVKKTSAVETTSKEEGMDTDGGAKKEL